MRGCTLKKLSLCLLALTLVGAAQLAAADRKSSNYLDVYPAELTTYNYLVTGSESEQAVAANCVDTLVEYDRYGVLKPGLATSWSSSADGLVWTFKLRPGVKWLTWQGKEYGEVTAQDWVDAAKYLLTKDNASQTADVFYSVIAGAEDYFNGKTTDIAQVGVKAKDKYTVEYTLAKPYPYFLSMLTYVCFLPANGKFLAEVGPKWGTDNKTILYNGAYIVTDWEPQTSREMSRNDKYWDRGNVFIPKLILKYNKEAATLAPELFLRGEISYSVVPGSIVDTWMKDPAKKAQLHPARTTYYTYFYAFNFNPKFDAQYEPDNWRAAVNNKDFRLSIFHALDRRAAMATEEPYSPERRLSNTITPRYFVSAGGKDYDDMGDLAAIAKTDSFDKAAALRFKAAAMKELAGKVTFPVKIMMPYNTSLTGWVNRAQVIQQQLEGLLGKDYITVIPVGFPPTGFLAATRRAGNYALQECNWGPDYADPSTYTDPFYTGSNYNWPEMAVGYKDANGKPKWENMVDAANAEVKNMQKRYALFAKAEAFFIGEAFVIPYGLGGGGYEASKLEPFTAAFSPFGMSNLKYKGQIVMPKALSTEEFQKLEAACVKERNQALKAAQ